MIYEPKILYNPKKEAVEFMCGRQVYRFEPGEKRNLDGFVAHHALVETNTGLKEYDIDSGEDVTVSNVAYDRMPWREIVSMASKRGVFKPGVSKADTIKALIEADEQETGTVQESTSEETE